MADYYFPRDILTEIFLWLPAKTLRVYSSLCKLWRDIITDPFFITKYSSKSNRYQGKKRFIFLQNYPKGDDPESEIEYVNWPCENIRKFIKSNCDILDYRLHGFCKGLLLLSAVPYSVEYQRITYRTFFIINPSLNVFFPLSTFEEDDDHSGYLQAFIAFDSISNDYKVLVILHLSYDESSPPVISLYSLSTDSWKDISVDSQYPHMVSVSSENLVFINGYLHWKASKQREDEPSYSLLEAIVRFDVTREVFDTMCFPGIIFDSEYGLSIANVFGKICIGHSTLSVCSIWLMNEYGVESSWTKQYQVEEPLLLFGSHLDGELLFSCFKEGNILAYNPKSNERKYLRHPTNLADWQTLYMENLEESLVLFDCKKPIPYGSLRIERRCT